MGNSQTQMKKQNKKNVAVPHPVFENAQLVRNTMGKEVMEIRVSVRSQKEYQQWVKSYKRIPRTQSMLFPQQTTFSNKGCCGSGGIAQIQYPLFPYILSQQISTRRQNNHSHFKQQQIWLLLFSLIQAAQMFHVRKLKLGDIRPQNVFMNSTGDIKILTQFTYPYAVTNYTHAVTNHEYNTYLAPQQIKDIQFGKIKDTNDPLIVESFSIGLTVLDAVLLASSERFYQTVGMFAYQLLDQSLGLIEKKGNYSAQLTTIVKKMCDPQPSNRLKANQVLKCLKPFVSQILNKQAFNLSSLPWGSNQQSKNVPNNNNNNNKIIGNNNTINVDNKNININPNNPSQKYQPQPQQITTKSQDYKFIPGVVFDSRDEGLLQSSSLKNGKQVVIGNSRVANTYEIPQKSQLIITDLQCPVQTSIYYPPITIQLPPPIQHNVNANRSP